MIAIIVKPTPKRTQAELEMLIPVIQKIQFFKERDISYEHYVNITETLSYEFAKRDQTVFN
jgi:hypothetical protein